MHGHVRPKNHKGLVQALTTLLPIAVLWCAARSGAAASPWLVAAGIVLMSLFLLRGFVLMHECGHGSLFRSASLNRGFGFVFGVTAGISQTVWSQRHNHHHATNGNWARYRGPLNVIAVEEYAAMTPMRQRAYRLARNIWLAPIGGLFYLVLIPRFTWLRASLRLLTLLVRGKLEDPRIALRTRANAFGEVYCTGIAEYWQMFWNNIALLVLWGCMAWAAGPLLFAVCYLVSLSLAGGGAIVLFSVQHNFRHAYASADTGWDRTQAAISGTSFLILPAWLNWFTANIAYHHVHHLCAAVPNYCLVRCHQENIVQFSAVTRIRLSQIPAALKFILWDTAARRIVSAAEHGQALACATR